MGVEYRVRPVPADLNSLIRDARATHAQGKRRQGQHILSGALRFLEAKGLYDRAGELCAEFKLHHCAQQYFVDAFEVHMENTPGISGRLEGLAYASKRGLSEQAQTLRTALVKDMQNCIYGCDIDQARKIAQRIGQEEDLEIMLTDRVDQAVCKGELEEAYDLARQYDRPDAENIGLACFMYAVASLDKEEKHTQEKLEQAYDIAKKHKSPMAEGITIALALLYLHGNDEERLPRAQALTERLGFPRLHTAVNERLLKAYKDGNTELSYEAQIAAYRIGKYVDAIRIALAAGDVDAAERIANDNKLTGWAKRFKEAREKKVRGEYRALLKQDKGKAMAYAWRNGLEGKATALANQRIRAYLRRRRKLAPKDLEHIDQLLFEYAAEASLAPYISLLCHQNRIGYARAILKRTERTWPSLPTKTAKTLDQRIDNAVNRVKRQKKTKRDRKAEKICNTSDEILFSPQSVLKHPSKLGFPIGGHLHKVLTDERYRRLGEMSDGKFIRLINWLRGQKAQGQLLILTTTAKTKRLFDRRLRGLAEHSPSAKAIYEDLRKSRRLHKKRIKEERAWREEQKRKGI